MPQKAPKMNLVIPSGGSAAFAGTESRDHGLLAAFRWRLPWRILSLSFLCAFCASAFSSPLFAQGCSLCNEQASQAGEKASRAINHGILLLLIPTLLLFVGVIAFAVRRAQSAE